MDIKTVIRAASQRLGLEKKADTSNYYRPWGFNPDGSVRRPSGQAPGMQKTPPQPRAFGGKVVPTHSATAYNNRGEIADVHSAINAENAHIQDLTRQAEEAQKNSELGMGASVNRGRIYQNGYATNAVNSMDSTAAARSAKQFAGAPKTTATWWKPQTWFAKGAPGVNANSNIGVQTTSSKLTDKSKSLTPEERAAEERRVRAANWRVRQGTAINLMAPKKFWPANKVDIKNIYTPKVWGTHVADLSQLPPKYGINPKTNADTRTQGAVSPYNPWKTDENGDTYRDITAEDIKYDREMRAKDLMNAFYGDKSYNGNEESVYNDMLERMSRMRNNPEYYKDGTWTSGALDYWRGDDQFRRAYGNIHNGNNYDQNAVLNAFLANANNMYWDNAPFVPKQKPTGI